MYRAGHRRKNLKHRRKFVAGLSLLLLIGLGAAGIYIKELLNTPAVVTNAKPVTEKVRYDETLTKHDEINFSLHLPSDWKKIPSPAGPYTTYSWQTSHKGTDGELITIYEDTLPLNLAVNRVVVLEPQGDSVIIKGGVSDNCITFTKKTQPTANQAGVPAKWMGIDFLCDQSNQARNVIGTSSADGINKTVLKSPTTGKSTAYLFTYSNQSVSPDYTTLINALGSFKIK